jgi:para-aminobenzoate synthetase/4-amino-4-deoxychorismate lyase
MGAGSGVVIDSDAAGEYRECLLKGKFLMTADETVADRFELLESLLWRGEYPLLELHLDRLEESAEYFGFACEREAARAALLGYAAELQATGPRKVRLLLAANGGLRVEGEAIAEETLGPSTRPLRARMARTRTDSGDRMLYHKTTHRPLYAKELAEAVRDGYDEVIFSNERGEITEGAHHNVLVEVGGRMLTPPVECGLLGGVFRRHLLATRPEIRERVLFPEDLRQADQVYLANAVRGLRRATIAW